MHEVLHARKDERSDRKDERSDRNTIQLLEAIDREVHSMQGMLRELPARVAQVILHDVKAMKRIVHCSHCEHVEKN